MQNKITFESIRLSKLTLCILCALVGSYMLDLGKSLKQSDISPSGIISLELADNSMATFIVKSWKNDKTNIGSLNLEKARCSIYIDFFFILLYASLLYKFMLHTLEKWTGNFETFFGKKYDDLINNFIKNYKIKFSMFLVIIIGLLDVTENNLMLFKIKNTGNYYIPYFAVLKFVLLAISIFFIFYSYIYWFLISYMGEENAFKNSLNKILIKIGFIQKN